MTPSNENVFRYVDSHANGRLTYNSRTGVGEVKFSKLWLQNSKTYQLDVLADWIFDLQEEYDRINCLPGKEQKS